MYLKLAVNGDFFFNGGVTNPLIITDCNEDDD